MLCRYEVVAITSNKARFWCSALWEVFPPPPSFRILHHHRANLRTPCRARCLHIYPTFWETRIALRIELLGGPGPDWIQPVCVLVAARRGRRRTDQRRHGMVEDESMGSLTVYSMNSGPTSEGSRAQCSVICHQNPLLGHSLPFTRPQTEDF